MDDFDVKLLQALGEDGRLTDNDLGDRVGLSASQCSRRRSALENAGVIEGYHAALSSDALGLAVHGGCAPSSSADRLARSQGN